MIRVVIVEDEDLVRHVTARALREQGFEVFETADAMACRALLKRQRVEAVVIDLNLPGLDGMSFAGELRNSDDIGVLIVTRDDKRTTRLDALNTCADDYLLKPVDFEELSARIRSVVRRRVLMRGRRWRTGRWTIDFDSRTVVSGEEFAHLTRGEFAILARLVEAHAKIVSREDLQLAIGRQQEADLRSVDSLVSRLRRKLGDQSEANALIVTAPGFGYRLREAAKGE